MFNVYYLVAIIYKKKWIQYLRQKKANVFKSAGETSLSGTEYAVESLTSRYSSMSDTMELICQTFDGNKRKLKAFFITYLLL